MTVAAALSFAAVVTLAPAVAGDARAATSDEARIAIEQLLERRAQALLQRDRSMFLETIQAARGAFRRRQLRLWRNLGEVPVASYELTADWNAFGDLARPADQRRYEGAGDVVIPLTRERYRIRGYDPAPANEDQFFTFVERGGRWSIASDSDLEDVGMFSARQLWDFGKVVARQADGHLLLGHPCTPSNRFLCEGGVAGAVLSVVDDAIEEVDETWPRPWRRRILIIAPRGASELQRMLQATFDVGSFVAFAYSTVDEGSYVGHRIVLNPEGFVGRSRADLLHILAHELLHVATRGESGDFVPAWVEEGLAEHAATGDDPTSLSFLEAELARGRAPSLPENYQFLTGSGASIYLRYQEAQSAVDFFVERWGIGELVEFYRRLGRVRVAPGTARYHLDSALRETIGIGLTSFERRWADSIAG